MNGKELNKLRLKAEIMLDKANQLIRFCDMVDSRKSVLRKHFDLLDTKNIAKYNHAINRKQVLINSLKTDLQCIN
jgi:capsule polysaccharide export protein KpsC/LpsZ|tara:strand:+ start:1257 stop:1481 length:225 start_codon:yes stop_codon:yes gene_type:complete